MAAGRAVAAYSVAAGTAHRAVTVLAEERLIDVARGRRATVEWCPAAATSDWTDSLSSGVMLAVATVRGLGVVRIRRGTTVDPVAAMLAGALDEPEILRALQPGVGKSARKKPAAAVVLIALSPPCPADPRLVHELVDELYQSGWTTVTLAGALDTFDRDRGYRALDAVARNAGYLGVTRAGNRYAIVDLDDAVVAAAVPECSILFGHAVARAWAEAGLRVTVARNVTDATEGFRLGLQVLLGAAPPVPGGRPSDVAADLARYLGPDLALIDAIVSSHGDAGSAALVPLPTATVVAGTDALLVDVVGAGLQGVDPATSRLCAAALRQNGLPEHFRIDGDQRPYAGWQPTPPGLLATSRQLDASPPIARIVAALAAPAEAYENSDDRVLVAMRRMTKPWLEVAGSAERAALAAAGAVVASAGGVRQAWATVFAKDRIDRVELPLGFEIGNYSEADYDAVPGFVDAFKPLLEADSAAEGDCLRFRYFERAVIFEAERIVAAPFEQFVARVDIAEGISLMADYVGGRRVAVSRDSDGRVVRQAERNVYLPQPNYVALWRGQPIDVGKIERVDYGGDWRRLSWRTVVSPNGSATYDDGALTFAAAGPNRTRLTVFGRQLFTLPQALEALQLDLYPQVKHGLVTDAYRRFFTATFDNLEACYEGREFRVGRAPVGAAAMLPTAAFTLALDMAHDWLAEKPLSFRLSEWSPTRKAPVDTDADGFRHFAGRCADPGNTAGTTGWARRTAAELSSAWSADRDRVMGR